MAAGTLRAEVKLDDPNRIHYGSEPVSGNVVLSFRRGITTKDHSPPSEFFGPLKISVTFHGRLKSKIRVKRGNSSSTYRGRVTLFSKTVNIFDNSAKIAANERWPVPFELFFPEGFESRIIDGAWETDPKYDTTQEQPLPPSFLNNYSGFSNHYESFVEYRMGVSVSAPHVPVDIMTYDKDTEPLVQYQQPKLPSYEPKYHHSRNTVAISNEYLLPEEDRPSGFRQKAKAAFSSDFYPHYNFDWDLVAPQHIYLGQPIPFEISVRPRENTAVVIPDILLTNFVVALQGSTNVRAEKQFFTCPEAGHEDTLKTFRAVYDSKTPFSKAHDWSKTLNTPAVPEGLTSTFRTVNISHVHSMKVTLSFRCAEKIISWEREYRVVLLPPVMNADTNAEASGSSAAAGSSSQPLHMTPIDEALPRYEEELPDYHEVAGILPPPAPKDGVVSGTASGTGAS